MRHTFLLVLIFLAAFAHGQQITLSVNAVDATCSANGSAGIVVNGGSGNYNFQLTNDCDELFPPQNTPNFTSLSPCTYSITVTDRGTGSTATETFTITGNTTPLSASIRLDVCDVEVVARGGRPPYTIVYTLVENGREFTETFTDTLRLAPVGSRILRGTVSDNCGNSRPVRLDANQTAVTNFQVRRQNGDTRFSARGGLGPYTYTVTSTVGTFTNTTGIFPDTDLGCDLVLSIESACPNIPFRSAVTLRGSLLIRCVNLMAGTVEVEVDDPGVPPYTYRVSYDGGMIESDEPVITGIPADAQNVVVSAFDACNNILSGRQRVLNNQPLVRFAADGCDDRTLPIQLGRTCGGDVELPITFTCTTCPDEPTLIQENSTTPVIFPEIAEPGTNRLEIIDGCGNLLVCRDTTFLEVQSACDSVIATYVRQFVCSNGARSRQVVNDPNFRYTLLDQNRQPISAEQAAPAFSGLANGQYFVAVRGDCALDTAGVALVASQPIDPEVTVAPFYQPGTDGNGCTLSYVVQVDQAEGPYLLTGLDDPTVSVQLNDFGLQDCSTLDVPVRLRPGRYRLASLSLCGEKEFELPDLDLEERLNGFRVDNNCPDNSLVIADALLRRVSQWRTFFADAGLNSPLRGQVNDFLSIDGVKITSSDSIFGIPPGDHILGVHIGFAGLDCPRDTVHFNIPEYEPVQLRVRGNVLCNETGEAPVRLTPRRGNPPYVIRLVDCDNPRNIEETYLAEEGDTIEVITRELGSYCYIVEDACGVTTDFQVEVRRLVDQSGFIYDCELPGVRLISDTLPGPFTWFGEDGSVVGRGNDITIPPALDDRTFQLEVETVYCLLEAEIEVPGRPILPELRLDPGAAEVLLCEGNTRTLTAISEDAVSIVWEGGDAGAEFVVTEQGTYSAVATNDIGCTTEATVDVREVPNPTVAIQIGNTFCPGEPIPLFVNRDTATSILWTPLNTTTDTALISIRGQYFVTRTDANGCTAVDSVTLDLPEPLFLDVMTDSATCFGSNDGALTVLSGGGTGALRYTINDRVFDVGEMVDSLPGGTYVVRLIDENECVLASTVEIGQPDSFLLDLGPDQFVDLGETVDVPVFSNQLDYAILGVNPPLDTQFVNEQIVTIRPNRSLQLNVTIIAPDGCTAVDSVGLFVDRALPFYAPTAFSPNADGVNDVFTLQGRRGDVAAIENLQIFDRWGNLMYSMAEARLNDFAAGWAGGTPDRQPAPQGTYVWHSTIRFFDGTVRSLSGSVVLIR